MYSLCHHRNCLLVCYNVPHKVECGVTPLLCLRRPLADEGVVFPVSVRPCVIKFVSTSYNPESASVNFPRFINLGAKLNAFWRANTVHVYSQQNRFSAGGSPHTSIGCSSPPNHFHFKGTPLREMQRGHFGASRSSDMGIIVRSGGLLGLSHQPHPVCRYFFTGATSIRGERKRICFRNLFRRILLISNQSD